MDYYDMPYGRLSPKSDVRDYCQAVYLTLLFWRRVHNNGEWWAEDGVSPYENSRNDVSEFIENATVKGVISNNYYSFDVRNALIDREAAKTLHYYGRCQGCGWLVGAGQECDCEEEQDRDGATIDEVADFLRDIDYQSGNATWDDLLEVMEGPGFAAYFEGVGPYTSSIIEEVGDCLRRFNAAESNEDLLLMSRVATAIWHVNGNLVRDYGDRFDLSDAQVNSIRDNGLADWFGEEEVAAFLEGEFEPLEYLDEEFDCETESLLPA